MEAANHLPLLELVINHITGLLTNIKSHGMDEILFAWIENRREWLEVPCT